jgi:hypothetical protein
VTALPTNNLSSPFLAAAAAAAKKEEEHVLSTKKKKKSVNLFRQQRALA